MSSLLVQLVLPLIVFLLSPTSPVFSWTRMPQHFEYRPTRNVDPFVEQALNLNPGSDGIAYPGSRSQHAMTAAPPVHFPNGKISTFVYLLGGRGVSPHMNDLWSYEVETARWTEINPRNQGKFTKPGARVGHAFLTIPWNNNNNESSPDEYDYAYTLRVFGGAGYGIYQGDDEDSRFLQDVWDYSPDRNRWTFRNVSVGSEKWVDVDDSFVDPPGIRPGSRSGACAWIVGEDMYVFGGIKGLAFSAVEYMWIFREDASRWEVRQCDANLPPAGSSRCSWTANANAVGDVDSDGGPYLYVFGGWFLGSVQNALHRYDVSVDAWEFIIESSDLTANRDMVPLHPGARSGMSCVAVENIVGIAPKDHYALVFGGQGYPAHGEGFGEEFEGRLADVWRVNVSSVDDAFSLLRITIGGEELHRNAPGSYVQDAYPQAREHTAMVRAGRKILLYGGLVMDEFRRSDMWVMNIPCESWDHGCEVLFCAGKQWESANESCSGHGKCDTHGGFCVCEQQGILWDGSRCEDFVGSCPLMDHCSGHGKCLSEFECECEYGYTGPLCSVPICYTKIAMTPEDEKRAKEEAEGIPDPWADDDDTDTPVCSGLARGNCTAADTCECVPGYFGLECQYSHIERARTTGWSVTVSVFSGLVVGALIVVVIGALVVVVILCLLRRRGIGIIWKKNSEAGERDLGETTTTRGAKGGDVVLARETFPSRSVGGSEEEVVIGGEGGAMMMMMQFGSGVRSRRVSVRQILLESDGDFEVFSRAMKIYHRNVLKIHATVLRDQTLTLFEESEYCEPLLEYVRTERDDDAETTKCRILLQLLRGMRELRSKRIGCASVNQLRIRNQNGRISVKAVPCVAAFDPSENMADIFPNLARQIWTGAASADSEDEEEKEKGEDLLPEALRTVIATSRRRDGYAVSGVDKLTAGLEEILVKESTSLSVLSRFLDGESSYVPLTDYSSVKILMSNSEDESEKAEDQGLLLDEVELILLEDILHVSCGDEEEFGGFCVVQIGLADESTFELCLRPGDASRFVEVIGVLLEGGEENEESDYDHIVVEIDDDEEM